MYISFDVSSIYMYCHGCRSMDCENFSIGLHKYDILIFRKVPLKYKL